MLLVLGIQSFRPKYRKLAELKDYFQNIPFIALTATLNKIGTQDVANALKMDSPVKFIHSLDRLVFNTTCS